MQYFALATGVKSTTSTSMTVSDYFTQGKRSFFRLHEKIGKYNVIPAHHVAQEYLDEYITAVGIEEDAKDLLLWAETQLDKLERSVMTNVVISGKVQIETLDYRRHQSNIPSGHQE